MPCGKLRNFVSLVLACMGTCVCACVRPVVYAVSMCGFPKPEGTEYFPVSKQVHMYLLVDFVYRLDLCTWNTAVVTRKRSSGARLPVCMWERSS